MQNTLPSFERVPGKLALRLHHASGAVEFGAISRHSKRLFYAVYRGQTYVGDAPALNPTLTSANGEVLEENVTGVSLHDTLLRIAGDTDTAHVVYLTHLAPSAHDLHLHVRLRNPFPLLAVAGGDEARYLGQGLRLFPLDAA